MALASYGDWDGVPENFEQAAGSVLETLWGKPEIITEFRGLMDAADALEKKQPPSRPINLESAMELKAFCDAYLASRVRREAQKAIRQRQAKTEESPTGNRKFADGARVRGREEGAASFRGRTGTVTSYVPGSGYWVNFDDGRTENVPAHWLEVA